MRRNKWITYGLPIMCFVFVLLFGAARVYAASAYGFEADDLSAEEKQTIWLNINVQRISEFQNLTDFSVPIESFDVSEQGIILLKLKGNIIVVSNEQGRILSCFEFQDEGSSYVKWNGTHILLLMERGNLIAELTQNGQMIDMVQEDASSIENNAKWNQISQTKSIHIRDADYVLQNRMGFLNFFASGFSQLLKKEQNGNTIMLYDSSKQQLARTIGIFALVFFFVILVIAGVIRAVINSRKGTPPWKTQ